MTLVGWIQILGVGKREDVVKLEYLIKHGEFIPGTNKPEYFKNGSYYVRDPLRDISEMMKDIQDAL